MINKPSNARWLTKAVIDGSARNADFAPEDPAMLIHGLPEVEVAWYDDDKVKVTFKNGCPAVIRQAYLSGADRDLIVEFQKQ